MCVAQAFCACVLFPVCLPFRGNFVLKATLRVQILSAVLNQEASASRRLVYIIALQMLILIHNTEVVHSGEVVCFLEGRLSEARLYRTTIIYYSFCEHNNNNIMMMIMTGIKLIYEEAKIAQFDSTDRRWLCNS